MSEVITTKDPFEINDNTNDDEAVLESYLQLIEPENTFYIDIGAGGRTTAKHCARLGPNLTLSTLKNSELTVFFECDKSRDPGKSYSETDHLPNVVLSREKVTPENVNELLDALCSSIDHEPKLVDLDIDGYDFFVLEALLEKRSPIIIMAEINEKIPPPIKFTVKYDPSYSWGGNHFFGMSLSKLCELLDKHEYDLINLTFNNAYAVRRDKNPGLRTFTAMEAHETFYKNAGWEKHFGWNVKEGYGELLTVSSSEALKMIHGFYEQYNGKYELELGNKES